MERFRAFLYDVRSSLWFIPGALAATAIAAAWAVLRLDRWIDTTPAAEAVRAFGGGPDSARSVMGTIAGGMITIAGVSFSIVVIALVLASNQFSPRVLGNFTRDRVNQTVLGVFVGTFVYSVLVLRSIRSGPEGGAYVPVLGVTLGVVAAIVALGFFIYFIDRIAQSIQASQIVRSVATSTHAAIDSLFDREAAATGPARLGGALPAAPDGPRVRSDAEGYVVRLDAGGLVEAAAGEGLVLTSVVGPGDFVARGAPLAVVDREPSEPDAFADRVRGAYVLGRQRTIAVDPSFGFRELVDIAVRALSPGINDPHTACNCVDHLASLLRGLADRDWPASELTDDDGEVRVRLPAAGFGDFVELAFDEIRRYGRADLAVTLRLLEALAVVAEATERPGRRAALWERAKDVIAGADGGLSHPRDRARAGAAFERLASVIGEDPGPFALSPAR